MDGRTAAHEATSRHLWLKDRLWSTRTMPAPRSRPTQALFSMPTLPRASISESPSIPPPHTDGGCTCFEPSPCRVLRNPKETHLEGQSSAPGHRHCSSISPLPCSGSQTPRRPSKPNRFPSRARSKILASSDEIKLKKAPPFARKIKNTGVSSSPFVPSGTCPV